MPNDNLGTAHGRIRVTYDGRGAKQAQASYAKLSNQMEAMQRSMLRMEKAINSSEKSLRSADVEIKKVSKSTSRFGGDIFATRRKIHTFNNDIRGMASDLKLLYGVMGTTIKYVGRFSTAVKVLNKAGAYGANEQLKIFRSLSIAIADVATKHNSVIHGIANAQRAFFNVVVRNEQAMLGLRSAVTLGGGGFQILRNKILGVNNAMQMAPKWVQNMQKVNNVLMWTARAGIGLAALLGPLRMMDRLINNRISAKGLIGIGRGFTLLSGRMAAFGRITERVFGRDYFTPFANRLAGVEGNLGKFMDRTSVRSRAFSINMNRASRSLGEFAMKSKGLLGGIVLISAGMSNLWKRMQWFFKLPKPLMAALAVTFSKVLPGALKIFGDALKGVSNFIVGLWDGLKQLSGGLTVLPGLIASVGAAITGLVPLFQGLKDSFKNIFSDDPIEAMEAYMKLPQHLQPIASALLDQKKRWKDMQIVLQKVGFKGLQDDIRQISDSYFPIFEKGSRQVIIATRAMKDEFVNFLLQGQTKTNTSAIYASTAGSIMNLAKATQPAAAGLSEMSKVGSEFLRSMSTFAPVLANMFNTWSQANSQNGQMEKWMQDSVSGAYDLIRGLKSLTEAAFSVLTLFRQNEGENFLERFAESMERLNARVRESQITGKLAKIRDYVQDMGEGKMEEMVSLFRSFGDAIDKIIPFLKTLTDAFSGTFIPLLENALWVISNFVQVLNDLGITNLVGTILGWVGAFKLLPKWIAAVVDGVKVLAGTIMVLVNRGKVLSMLSTAFTGLGLAMTRFGSIGEKVGNGLANVTAAGSKTMSVVSSLFTGFTIAAAAAMAFYAVYSGNKSNSEAFNKRLKDNEVSLLNFRDALQKAFVEDKGLTGSNVMSSISTGLETMMQDLEATAKTGPDAMRRIWDYFSGTLSDNEVRPFEIGDIFGESDAINDAQEIANQAKLAAAGLKTLRDQGVDLAAVLASSDKDFESFVNGQRSLGHEGNAAAEALIKQRNVLKQTEEAMKRAGPGALALADGIKQIAEAGGDATAKLDGLKKILEALGLIKVDAIQAAADYEQGIADLTNRVTDLINEGNSLSQSDLMSGGTFNVATQQGRDFFNVMRQLGESFLSSVAAGNDADAAYKTFLDSLKAISEQTGISEEDLKSLGAQVGVLPQFAKIAIQLEGKDQAAQDMANAFFQMQSMVANGVNVPISIRPGDAEKLDKSLEQILGRDMTDVDNGNLVIKPGLSQVDVNKVLNKLGQMGIQIGDNNPIGPQSQAQLPVEVKPQQITPGEIAGAASGVTPTQPGSGQSAAQTQESLILGPLADAASQANTQGSAFVDALAKGIEDNPAAKEAAERLAQELKDRFHQSPPKKGPLSEHGDAARYAGQAFAQSYSGGLISGTANVAGAAEGIAGAASGSLKGDKNYEAGKFLGQISQLVDFASNFVDAVGKLTDTFLSAAKFMSDPLNKGTFFGKRPKWVRDQSISDSQLAKQRADAAQQRVMSVFGNASRDTSQWDSTTGMMKIKGPGALQRDSSKQDIVAGMVAQGQAAGLSKEQIDAMVATAIHESGLNPVIVGKGHGAFQPGGGKGDAYGLFQQTEGWGTIEQRTDPNYAINKFIEAYKNNLKDGVDPLVAATLAQNPQLAGQVEGSDYYKKQQAALAEGMKAVNEALASGATTPMTSGMAIPGIGLGQELSAAGIQDSKGTSQQPVQVAGMLLRNLFGFEGTLGGSRQDSRPYHNDGRALDVMIPNFDTPEGKAFGNKVRDFFLANAEKLGVEDTIWQDIWQSPGGGNKKLGREGATEGHYDHVHISFKDGATADIGPNGTNLIVPFGSGIDQKAFELPDALTGNKPDAPERRWVQNADGSFTETTEHGVDGRQPPGQLNPTTGKPYTDAEVRELEKQMPLQFDLTDLKEGDLDTPGLFQGTQEQMLDELKNQTPLLQKALTVAQDENSSLTDTASALEILSSERDRQLEMDTPQSRALAGQLDSVIGTAASNQGLTEEQNPFDQAAEIAGAATSIAGDIFKVINSIIDTVGATKNLTTSLVRGWSNTEDVFAAIDDFQKFIQLGADIAGSVSSITGLAAGFVGAGAAGDPSGGASGAAAALGAVSQIAGLVQAGFETANAIIDLGQEAYRIIGSYVGDFLSSLTGGIAGGLQGQVKFLLDEQTNQLLAYSADNPLDKRAHTLPGQVANPSARDQLIGNINVYGGPGVDPRDQTRQMMFQVRSSQLMAATGQ